jgi:hypothetical protein
MPAPSHLLTASDLRFDSDPGRFLIELAFLLPPSRGSWRHEMVANRDAIKTRGGDELMSGAYPRFKPGYTHEGVV